MLKKILAASILLALASQATARETWVSTTSAALSDWKVLGVTADNPKGLYGCSNWAPKVASSPTKATPGTVIIDSTKAISQNATDCKIDQVRTIQKREYNRVTGAFRNIGTPSIAKMTLVNQYSSRDYKVEVSPWTNAGKAYNCSSWTPPTGYVPAGKSFVQTGTGCTLDQYRTRIESLVSSNVINYKAIVVKHVIEKQTLGQQTTSITAIGTKKVQ